ncbi:MAG: alpha/beta fold hydrolase [Acidobacteria bacterium]|nr:alpha/beta fold hydrolase [Acidobacteriota bacterium]
MREAIDRGGGVPLVLVPGIQGRWEYVRPAIDALSSRFRVIAFSLAGASPFARPAADRPAPDRPWFRRNAPDDRGRREGLRDDRLDDRGEPEGLPDMPGERALTKDAAGVARVLDDRGIDRAVVCGISFGGLVALRFAAMHPDRTIALVLASTPGPSFRLHPRHRLYARLPWLCGPLFLAESPWRLRAEICRALPRWPDRLRFSAWQLGTIAAAPLSLGQMARRAGSIESADPRADARAVSAPTLIVTGEPGLDRVVPVSGTLEYATLVRDARAVVQPDTGHLGSITRPGAFASLVGRFVDDVRQRSGTRRQGRAS